jgi:THO complex subunit 5
MAAGGNNTDAPLATENGNVATASQTNDEIASQIKTPHNTRLYQENQKLKAMVNDLVEYQLAHPRVETAGTRAGIDDEKEVEIQMAMKEKRMRAQLAVIKTLYRQSVMKVREEKSLTAESRNVNDALILQLHNLKYEEQSLSSEISAAQNFE